MRWGPGPVFHFECLATSRRWQTYAVRSFGVVALLVAMGTIAFSRNAMDVGNSWRDYAQLGESYFYAMIGVELALVMLAAPAATAGAISLDRARGTLAHVLVTDLSDVEIVLGKLGARLLPVLGLVAYSWPVLAISSLLGGIDPIALVLAFAVIVAVGVFGCTLALALSVWARKTYEVILATYTVWILGLLLWPIWLGLMHAGVLGPLPPWTLLFNPFYVAFAPYAAPGKLEFSDYLGFFGVTLAASALLTILAVRRMRPVARRGSIDARRGPRLGLLGRVSRWLPGPSLDRNPVLWREWHRSRPSPWMMVLLTLLMGTTGVLCLGGAIAFWKNGVDFLTGNTWEMAGVYSYLLHVIFGLLMLSAIAPTSMSEERQRGSLDVLAATALSTRDIVVGKWLGTFRLAALMAVGPGLLALATATAREASSVAIAPGMPPEYYRMIPLGGRIFGVLVVIATILAHGALITSIGLALAVWIRRQSRAIALCVALFILIAAAWPTFASITIGWPVLRSRDLPSFSPIVACFKFIRTFVVRRDFLADGILWWGSFWAVEVFVLALGLLWLTVLTFDRCFDRIPDRIWRVPVRAAVVVILAGLIGAGSLVPAVGTWINGVLPHDLEGQTSADLLGYAVALAIGLVLVVAVPAKSIATGSPRPAPAPEAAQTAPRRNLILRRWWESFRLVLLLAIGPAILALALATAHRTILPVTKATTLPSGGQTFTWVEPDPAEANVERIGEVRLAPRLASAALLIVTILAHGAAAVSVGLALALAIERPRRASALGVGLIVAVIVVLPLYISAVTGTDLARRDGMWNFVIAAESLLAPLLTRIEPHIREILARAMTWDVIITLFAAGVLGWTIRPGRRRAA
jgi:ABC-type transport system involved in multi-copper enzyme maturation permease subunit